MTQSNRSFQVFAFSSFTDRKPERNALQERVFPRLWAIYLQHRIHFQSIHIHLGVSEEGSLTQYRAGLHQITAAALSGYIGKLYSGFGD
jgi:hypothetical protein